jgi:hypothetical protein
LADSSAEKLLGSKDVLYGLKLPRNDRRGRGVRRPPRVPRLGHRAGARVRGGLRSLITKQGRDVLERAFFCQEGNDPYLCRPFFDLCWKLGFDHHKRRRRRKEKYLILRMLTTRMLRSFR